MPLHCQGAADAQRREVQGHFSGGDWVVTQLMAAMREAPDFYFGDTRWPLLVDFI
jgi:hypothetical protein